MNTINCTANVPLEGYFAERHIRVRVRNLMAFVYAAETLIALFVLAFVCFLAGRLFGLGYTISIMSGGSNSRSLMAFYMILYSIAWFAVGYLAKTVLF